MMIKLRQLGPNRRVVMYLNLRTGLIWGAVVLVVVAVIALVVLH